MIDKIKEQSTEEKLKYLFCPMAQKAGTTYLYNLLNQFEEVSFSLHKELCYFKKNRKNIFSKQLFQANFNISDETKYLADFYPIYLIDDYSIEGIKTCCGDDAKFVLILRDPIKRAFSNYRMDVTKNIEIRSFHEVIMSEINGSPDFNGILARSSYSKQIDRLLRYYPRESFLVEEFGNFITNPQSVAEKVCDFLEIERKEINYKVGRFSSSDKRVAGLGRVLHDIPTSKKKLVFNSKLLNFIYRGIIYITRRKLKNIPTLEQKTIKILKEYFSKSNMIVSKKYGVNTTKWL